MTVGLVTAIFGGYDHLRPLPENLGVDVAVCVTDDPTMLAQGWETVVEDVMGPPILQAKTAKMRPDLYLGREIEFTIWMDGSHGLDHLPPVEAWLEHGDIGAFRHPGRDDAEDEAVFSATLPRYDGEMLRRQARHYRAAGLPIPSGLWACGFIVRRNTPAAWEFGDAWHAEIDRWGPQDQVSFPFVAWRLGIPIVDLPGKAISNSWLRHHGHG